VQHLHNLHPLTIHFPIAYLIGAALLYFVCWIRPNDALAWAAFGCLMLGFVSCTLAVGTGFYALWEVTLSNTVRQRLLTPHMEWMVLTWVITNVLAAWSILDKPFPRGGRRFFLLLFLVLLMAMTRGADYGSRLVYDYNAAGNAAPQPIRFSK